MPASRAGSRRDRKGGPLPDFPPGRYRRDASLAGHLVLAAAVILVGGGFLALRAWQAGVDVDGLLRDLIAPGGLGLALLSTAGWFARERFASHAGGTQRQVGELTQEVAAARADVAAITGQVGALSSALAEAVLEFRRVATPPPSSRYRAETGVQPAVQPVLTETEDLQLYATAVPPDPASVPLPEDVQARAWATWQQIEQGYDDPRSQ